MDFFITSDTAGAYVGELVSELRHILYSYIENNYSDININIGIVIRCLPKSYKRKSFTRYLSTKNDLTIDFCVPLEKYEQMYKIEQRFELGKIFLKYLDLGLSNDKILTNNTNFNINEFKNKIIELGEKCGWFVDEIDYSQDLEF